MRSKGLWEKYAHLNVHIPFEFYIAFFILLKWSTNLKTQLVSVSTIFYLLSAPTLYGCITTEIQGWEVSMCNTVLHSKINDACFPQKPHSLLLGAGRDSKWVRGKPQERLIVSTSQEQHYNVNQNRLTELGYYFNLPTRHKEKYVKKKPGWREILKIKPSKSWTFTENITVKLHKHTMSV